MTNAQVFLKEIESSEVYSKYLSSVTINEETKIIDGVITLKNDDNYMLVEKKVRDLFINASLNMSFIDSGCFRCVFTKSNLVAKVTYNEDGSNKRELCLIELLKKHNLSHLLDYLCPVLASNDNILITPLCSSLYTFGSLDMEVLESVSYSKTSQKILNEFKKEGITFKYILGIHQWGILNGNLVILDYADWTATRKELLR